MSEDTDDLPRFAVVESDPFEADSDRAILSVGRLLGSRSAGEWAAGLSRLLSSLPAFPGPLSHARDEEACAYYGREVRRLLCYGPTRRRSGVPVRLLFTIFPPNPDESPDMAESVIFLLRLLHGAQVLQADPPSE